MNKYLSAAMIMAVSAYGAVAEETRMFSYPADGEDILYFGDQKAQTYDIAIKICDPALTGKKVTGVKVALCGDAQVSDPKGWLSSELLLDSKKKNAPDIAEIEATVSEDNVLTASFPEPYLLTEEGVYAGYSITIKKAETFGDKNPNPVAECINTDGAFIHSTRTNLKWTTLSQYNVASCMEVVLEGDFPEYGVCVADVSRVRTDGKANSVAIPLKLVNWGATEVSEATVSYTFAGKSGEKFTSTANCLIDSPIPAKLGSSASTSIVIPSIFESGTLTVAVTEVNGQANTLSGFSAEGGYVLMTFVPRTRPLMEEYTGLWCGFCPRGWVAMEELHELYPEDFIGVAYHDSDEMQYIIDTPDTPSGYPQAFFNRSIAADPYYGLLNSGFGARTLWLDLCEQESPADIDVDLEWSETDPPRLTATSRVKFVGDESGDEFVVNYILVGDGFKSIYVYDEDGKVDRPQSIILKQSNNYSGAEPPDDSPLWNLFTDGGSRVDNIVFNDVAMALSPLPGEKAFPEKIEGNTVYEHQYDFDYGSIKNIEGTPRNILRRDGTLRCVAVLSSADGKFLNCNKSQPVDLSGVKSICEENDRIISTEWYDLTGRKLPAPSAGVAIRIDRMADGMSRTSKVIKFH